MSTPTDPLSFVAMLLQEIKPSKWDESRQREREREHARRRTEGYRAKNRIRVRTQRSKAPQGAK